MCCVVCESECSQEWDLGIATGFKYHYHKGNHGRKTSPISNEEIMRIGGVSFYLINTRAGKDSDLDDIFSFVFPIHLCCKCLFSTTLCSAKSSLSGN